MQIVIDIPEEKYDVIKNNYNTFPAEMKEWGLEAIRNGMPQPETGKWIEERTYMECPNCHDIWHYEENQTERFKFCPTCGAWIEGHSKGKGE